MTSQASLPTEPISTGEVAAASSTTSSSNITSSKKSRKRKSSEHSSKRFKSSDGKKRSKEEKKAKKLAAAAAEQQSQDMIDSKKRRRARDNAAKKNKKQPRYLGEDTDEYVMANPEGTGFFKPVPMARVIRAATKNAVGNSKRWSKAAIPALAAEAEAFLGHRLEQASVWMENGKKPCKTLTDRILRNVALTSAMERGEKSLPVAMLKSIPRKKKNGGKARAIGKKNAAAAGVAAASPSSVDASSS